MSIRSIRRASSCAALVLVPAAALAGESADEAGRRLDDDRFFVQKLGRGWEPLLSDMDATLATLKDAPEGRVRPVRATCDGAREDVAKMRLADGTEAGESRALELYEVLAGTAVDESRRRAHHGSCADIYMKRADAATKVDDETHDASAFDDAMKALAHVPGLERAFSMIARLGLKVGLAAKEREDYDAALEKLDGTKRTLVGAGVQAGGESLKKVDDVVAEIRRTTGPLSVAWLGDPKTLAAVKGGRTDFSRAALSFAGAAKAPPTQTADHPRRMRVGKWRVTATGAGGTTQFAADVVVTPDGGELTLLVAIPDGMLFVSAAGGDDAFLVDRTETSNAQYEAMTGRRLAGDPRVAAAGLSFAEAKAAAEGAGKRLPTLVQWTHAAFGAPGAKSPRYPWGENEGEQGVQFVGGVDGPQDVESCPAGASPCGCLNMAGNVMEWIDYRDGGWLLGGGWKGKFSREPQYPDGYPDGFSWKADLLRDPIPTAATYDAFPANDKADQAKYLNYKATDNTLPQAGMRCVVPLGKPWRRP